MDLERGVADRTRPYSPQFTSGVFPQLSCSRAEAVYQKCAKS